MKFFCTILISASICLVAVAADQKEDSLRTVLNSHSESDTIRVFNLINLGNYLFSKNAEETFPLAMEAKKIADSLHYTRGIEHSYALLGNYYFGKGDYSNALDMNLQVLKLQEESGNKKGMARTYRNLGGVHLNSKNYNKALKYYEEALNISTELNLKKDIASTLGNIAIVYHQKEDFGKAMEYNLKALKVCEEMKDMRTKSHVLNSIGRLFFDMGKKDENRSDLVKAIDYYQQSLAIKEKLKDKRGMANTLGNIGEAYMEKGDYEKSLDYFRRGMSYAEETDFKQWLFEGYEKISDLYKKSGDYNNAYEYYKKFIAVRDTIESAETKKTMAQLQGKYDTETKDKEIKLLSKDKELQEEKISSQRNIIWIGTIGMLVVIALAFFIFRGYKQIQKANLIIEEKNKNITDSIRYAKRIQTAILPDDRIISKHLKEYFVFYKPKDIVSGDFYFFTESGNKKIIAVADCTGHGVPGAFMSMIGNSLLNQIIKENGITKPSEILNQLHEGVREALRQGDTDADTKDGMDIALCAIDFEEHKLEYAGANRNLNAVMNETFIEIRADKFPIGGVQSEHERKFTNHETLFNAGDMIFLSTDGYADQFGGAEGKKFRSKRFKEMLFNNYKRKTSEQKHEIESTLNTWMEGCEQLDDILVIGVHL